MSTKKTIRELEGDGWRVEYTGSNHLRLTHPDARKPVFVSGSPSDWRAMRKVRRDMRMALQGNQEGKRA